tara:strand:+ start:116 stop:328 length:213 start_codon:yes stop_codon:yes gene_type:complete
LLPNCYKRLKISPALDGVFALNLDFMSKQAWLWKILEAPRKKVLDGRFWLKIDILVGGEILTIEHWLIPV